MMMGGVNNNSSKFWRLLLIVTCALLIAAQMLLPAQAAGMASDYRSRALIQLSSSSGSYQFLALPDEVVSQSRLGLPDLRIYRGDEEIPYALLTDQELMIPARYERAALRNQGTDDRGNLVFEVQVPANKWVRQIRFLSQEKNFIRQVQVAGSRNSQEWVTLAGDRTIFDLTDEHKTNHNEVSLGQTNFTYLRVTIMSGGKGKFQLEGVELEYIPQTVAAVTAKERAHAMTLTRGKDGVDEYNVDMLQVHLPVGEVEFVANAENFNRLVEVYVSDNNQDWKFAARGEIYSYKLDKLTASKRSVKFHTDLRYIKLRVHNRDNQPLPVTELTVRGINPAVVFPAQGASVLYLYWNNEQVKAPVYDLSKFKGNLDYSSIPRAEAGAIETNPTFQFRDIRPWTERNAWLLQVILAVVAVGLLVVIVQSIRKISSDKQDR